MKLELEDLTKDELIRVIRKFAWLHASQRDLLFVRWDTLTKRADALLGESIKAGNAGDWKLADKRYGEYEKVQKRADAVYAAGMGQM